MKPTVIYKKFDAFLTSPKTRDTTQYSHHLTTNSMKNCKLYPIQQIHICTKMIISFVIDSVGIASILHLLCSSVVPKYFSLLETWLFSWSLKNTYCCTCINMYVKIKNCQPTLFCRQDVLLIFFINSFEILLI